MLDFAFLALIVLIIAVIFGIFLILRSLRGFIINAIIGLLILFLGNSLIGLNIGYSWLVILICGFGGAVGALFVIVFHIFGLGF
jgi:SigmaK-factor processing regulatory protein BofA